MKNSHLIILSLFAATAIFIFSIFEEGEEKIPIFEEQGRSVESAAVSEEEGGSFSALPEAPPEIPLYSPIAIVYDTNIKKILFSKSSFQQVPVASLTKLMTAMVFLETEPDLSRSFDILPGENVEGSRLYLNWGETVSLKDLLYASIVGSANNATLALVRSTGIPKEEFVERMNQKAIKLGLETTHFIDPTGLDPANVSSAYDIARLAEEAFKNEIIKDAASRNEYYLIVQNTGRAHTVKNPNKLLGVESGVGASKTGYLNEAGYCLAVQLAQKDNIIVVVLGSASKEANFADVKKLVQYFSQ